MSIEKNMNTRIQHKHDIEANWLKATNFTPLVGEIVVYDPDGNYDYSRIKIGDGKTNINSLPFIKDSVSPIATVSQTGTGAVISITDKDGTTTATITNGKDGKDGTSVTHSWNGTTLTITSASGTSSANLKGEKGDKGDTGAQGIQGEKGDKGDQGEQGIQGIQGETGETGATGAAGKSAYQYAKENGYTGTETEFGINLTKEIPTVTQEAGASETLVMSQKAVTDLVNDALGQNETVEYETVDSVDQMIDTTKQYVLSSTNTLWAYGEVAVEPTELYDPAKATMNVRHSGTPGSMVTGNGYVMTDYIPVDMTASAPVLLKVTCDGFNAASLEKPFFQKIGYYNSAKTCIGSKYINWSATSGKGVKTETSGNVTTIHVGYINNGSKETFYDQIAYVRIEVCGNNSPAVESDRNLITSIMLANSIMGYDWYDTGLAPSTGNNGGNYVTLLLKIEQNKTDITENSRRITALEAGSDTPTVPTFWQNAVDICISKIKALQVGRNCVTFPFFSDNHQRNGYAGMLIAHIMKECNIPYAFFGGDSIDSGYIASEAVMVEQDKKFDSMMAVIPNGRFCRAVGNHDGYWAVSANEKHYYTREQVYELFMREESVAQNKRYGEDGTYYYVDDIASKVRFIVLNTNDNDSDGGASVDSTQLEWMQNTALSFSESGWAVVFISHQPISNHYHANISNAEEVRTVVSNYISGSATNKADIIGWYSGHIHRDRIYTGVAVNRTDDSIGAEMPFTQVTITSDHTGIAYDAATKHPVANDDLSHAIDFVTINRNTRIVNLTRLGIGNDRSYTY